MKPIKTEDCYRSDCVATAITLRSHIYQALHADPEAILTHSSLVFEDARWLHTHLPDSLRSDDAGAFTRHFIEDVVEDWYRTYAYSAVEASCVYNPKTTKYAVAATLMGADLSHAWTEKCTEELLNGQEQWLDLGDLCVSDCEQVQQWIVEHVGEKVTVKLAPGGKFRIGGRNRPMVTEELATNPWPPTADLFSEDLDTHTNDKGGKQSKVPGRFDLLPPDALAEIAVVLEHGAVKYGEDNWRDIDQHDHINHAIRHLFRFIKTQEREDLSHAATRLLFAMETENE